MHWLMHKICRRLLRVKDIENRLETLTLPLWASTAGCFCRRLGVGGRPPVQRVEGQARADRSETCPYYGMAGLLVSKA
jgi:hypothetical protein